MEKIRKRKAIFRVEYSIYASSDEMFNATCTDLEGSLARLKDEVHTDVMGRGHIAALAQVEKVRRLKG